MCIANKHNVLFGTMSCGMTWILRFCTNLDDQINDKFWNSKCHADNIISNETVCKQKKADFWKSLKYLFNIAESI